MLWVVLSSARDVDNHLDAEVSMPKPEWPTNISVDSSTSSGWIRLYGQRLGERLEALQAVAGQDAAWKFVGGKLHGYPYGGLYVDSLLTQSDGIDVVCGLLDDLLRGELIRVVSLGAYYRNGRRIPAGMRLMNARLVDVLG